MATEPVRRSHFIPQATPAEVYAVVADFPAYPKLFPEFTSTRVIETAGQRHRVEFNVQVVMPARYVLDLVCDAEAHTIDWTFVEGTIISDSRGGWRFVADGGGTRIDYHAALEVNAPLPGFVLRKISNAILSASLPAMFSAISREVSARKRAAV
jgi:ribosome-associated toxin RatA of RatAB toxin-antitoxin module